MSGNSSKYCTAAVLVAAGTGSRYAEGEVPKQFIELAGKPLYRWSLERLCHSNSIDLIIIAAPESALQDVQTQVEDLGQIKPIHVIAGGATRQLSVFNALEHLEKITAHSNNASLADGMVLTLVHDAARPFLTRQLIESVIAGAMEHGAVTAAIPVADTVKRVAGTVIDETVDRNNLILVQTPQAARLDWLIAAHRNAIKDGTTTTDDAAILEKFGIKVHTISGSLFNIKVTTSEDMKLAAMLAQSPVSAFE
jgi:2-C-methyl-D-erythritol 4-phosphate cytidylyltransferase